jgi:hypothetical protein
VGAVGTEDGEDGEDGEGDDDDESEGRWTGTRSTWVAAEGSGERKRIARRISPFEVLMGS